MGNDLGAGIRVGVVGTGSMGRNHARIYSELGVLHGVSDVNQDLRNSVAMQYKVPITASDYRDLATTVDAVSIATPATTHHEIASFFLKKGIHVLVEKPVTTTLREAVDLAELATDMGKVLMVGHVDRYNPAIKEVFNWIFRPRWIEIVRTSPFPKRNADVDVVLDVMVHGLDTVQEMTRHVPPDEVRAWGMPVLFGNDDVATAWLEWRDHGTVANLTASRISENSSRQIRVIGDDKYGSLRYCSVDALAMTFTLKGISHALCDALGLSTRGTNPSSKEVLSIPDHLYDTREMKWTKADEPLKMELLDFLGAISGKPHQATIASALETMKLVERVRRVISENSQRLHAKLLA